jgi:mRNA interferase MazF
VSALPASFRPVITIGSEHARVLVEQMVTVPPERLGDLVGHLSRSELESITEALRAVLALD